MSTQQKTKVKRRLNPAVYSLLTGILFIVIGYMWLKVVDILIDIDGFGLGPIIHLLPYAGYATIGLGIVLIFINLIRMVISKPVVKETVTVKKKNVDPNLIQETSKFEKKLIRGLIFDLDGTLLNTLEDLATSGNTVLSALGYKTANLETYRLGLGRGLRNLMAAVLPPDSTDDQIDEAYKGMVDYYGQNYNVKTRPYEGIVDMLTQLNKRGYLMAVISNKKDEFTKELVKLHFPNIIFVDALGDHPDTPRKPDPALVQLISSKMMLPTSSIAMIGDSEVDIQTAKNTSMISIAVGWGYRSIKELRRAKPDLIVLTPSELVMELDVINQKDVLESQGVYEENELELEEVHQLEVQNAQDLQEPYVSEDTDEYIEV